MTGSQESSAVLILLFDLRYAIVGMCRDGLLRIVEEFNHDAQWLIVRCLGCCRLIMDARTLWRLDTRLNDFWCDRCGFGIIFVDFTRSKPNG